MPNFYLSASMSLVVPVVGVEIGPDWASDINASLTIIDAHTHAPGSGVQVKPDGININSDLTFNNTNNATNVRSVRFFPNLTTLSLPADIGVLYESGVDLYYNDGSGNQIRITQSGSLAGAAGTITGLPSGTASAAFLSGSGTFQFLQATGLGANFDIGTLILRYPGSYPTPSGNYIAIQAPSSLSTGYAITLPATTPLANGALLTEDTAGVLSYTNVDNTTLEINTGLIRIKAGSITGALIPDGGVALVKTAAPNIVLSGSSGTFFTTSATPVPVTNMSCTITTIGRPVMVQIICDAANGGMFIKGVSSGTNPIITMWRDGSIISFSLLSPSPVAVISTVFVQIDQPAAGTYTYVVKAQGSGGVNVYQSRLMVYEF